MARFHGLQPSDLSRFLHITLRDVKYPVSEQALHQVFHSYGSTTVRFCTSTTAVVSFPTMSQATRAGLEMQGRCIYTSCCWMQIQFAPEQLVASTTGTAALASLTAVPTTVEAPRLASISEASAGATPAPVCVLASPAPSPTVHTAADEKPVMASWAELQAKLDRILAKLTPMEDHDAAVTSTPSTPTTSPPTAPAHASPLATFSPSPTTTSSPTAPEHAPPSATITAATTTTTSPRKVLVPALATPEEVPANIELVMDCPLKHHVVAELSMSVPAKCSTEGQDDLSKQREATSAALTSTTIFTPVQKDGVLPASCMVTADSFQSVDGGSNVPVPAAGVLIVSIRVPPRPPDLLVPAPEDDDATKVMEASLLGVMSKLSMTGSVHHKERDQKRPMPWLSFVCYWPTTSSLKPRQTTQVIIKKLVIEDMQMVLHCPVWRYTLPNCSDGSRSGFNFLFPDCQKMVMQCLASINPGIHSPWRPPDRATNKVMLPYIHSAAMLLHVSGHFSQLHSNFSDKEAATDCLSLGGIFLYDMTQLPLEITWPPQGSCAILSLLEASFSSPQLRQMFSRHFGFVRRNCVTEFWAQPASAFAFQLCWKLQACHCIQCITRKHYRILTCIGKNTYCKQYMPYLAALATTSVALVTVWKGINCVVRFLKIWDPGIIEFVMKVPYYPGNTFGVFPSACRVTAVLQYMHSDHMNPLASCITHHCTTPAFGQLQNLIGGSHQNAEGEEAPEFRVESITLESKDCLQNAVDVGNKTYVIGRSDEDPKSPFGIKILDKLTQTWVVPTVLGAQPPSKSHSSILVNDEKILVVEKGVSLNDSIWFLEIDTPFVKRQRKIKGSEVVSWSKGVLGVAKKPVVISGPSGVGKGTLIAKLMKEYPSKFGFSVSHTTRSPRVKEIDGVHYHFAGRSKMEQDISEGKFLEFAHVHGNLYGTSIEAVESVTDEGKRCILDIDVQGARSVRASSLEAIFIFVCPPSFEELEKRLRARGTETEEQIQKRLKNARAELDQSNSPGLFDHLLVNDDLETCYENLKKLLSLDDEHEDSDDCFIKDGKATACYSILSKTESEILLQSDISEVEKGAANLLALDLSSLTGGAPGRTRGLKIEFVNSIDNGLKAIR